MRDERIAELYRRRTTAPSRPPLRSISPRSSGARSAPTCTWGPPCSSWGMVAGRAVAGHPMPAPEELDQLVEFVLNGISA